MPESTLMSQVRATDLTHICANLSIIVCPADRVGIFTQDALGLLWQHGDTLPMKSYALAISQYVADIVTYQLILDVFRGTDITVIFDKAT